MAHSKALQYIDYVEINYNISSYSKALSHPARVIIVRWLAKEGMKSAGEISAHIGLSMSTTSHHLACLEKAGFIAGFENGRYTNYVFNHVNFSVVRGFFDHLFDELSACAAEIAGREG
jgi:DNA-binding transcriptional ArsR family regulator